MKVGYKQRFIGTPTKGYHACRRTIATKKGRIMFLPWVEHMSHQVSDITPTQIVLKEHRIISTLICKLKNAVVFTNPLVVFLKELYRAYKICREEFVTTNSYEGLMRLYFLYRLKKDPWKSNGSTKPYETGVYQTDTKEPIAAKKKGCILEVEGNQGDIWLNKKFYKKKRKSKLKKSTAKRFWLLGKPLMQQRKYINTWRLYQSPIKIQCIPALCYYIY